MFNDFFDNDWMVRANATAPAINVLENEKSYDIELAAPGMTKDDFKVSLDDNGDLVVNMEKKEENNEEKKHGHYLRREFSYCCCQWCPKDQPSKGPERRVNSCKKSHRN